MRQLTFLESCILFLSADVLALQIFLSVLHIYNINVPETVWFAVCFCPPALSHCWVEEAGGEVQPAGQDDLGQSTQYQS